MIEPKVISTKGHTRERKPKAIYDEIFVDLPTWEEIVATLTKEEKQCLICVTQMVLIGHEVIRTESIYTESKLERIKYIATTYGCPACKDEEVAPFVKDNGTPALIPGNFASSGQAIHIMYYKYVISVPIYWQESKSYV